MQFLIYSISFPFLWIISKLPFRLFYRFSDCIYILVYYIIGYRKKIVRNNILIALPHISEEKRLVIEKKFFHHMCDMFLEMIKTMSISSEEMKERFKITNIELLKEYEQKNKSIILLAAHYASWEWLLSINESTSFKCYGVYKKVNNKYFDAKVRAIRSKFKSVLVTTDNTIALINDNEKNGIMSLYGLASDQSPQVHKTFHWQQFMGITVPVHTGAEMLAKRYDLEVVFAKVKKVKRGYYEATFVPIANNPKSIPDYEITDAYLKEVEQQILEAPEFYFWTHKRWKHRR
ncbi:lysophospholipid acyltransferase family protein [Flavobacterium sp.]|uniref:lysophospholipid acyltransferase family protein n=1 Tax=Flavobacterium sp. TaxID=239 RepID=UPI0008BBB3CA|nr:lysophospholipid acyltransferase family protein [Flavobacterium sp.]OGS64878.1 MAG: lipid A biosynthesis acyltransferase [Flavobacteria bacterium GWA2_35_26]HCF03541.1 lipid A biosynthesis acyltransferase [Flavobacterium sp.]